MIEPVKPDDQQPVPPPRPPAPKAEPGDNVKWIVYEKKQNFWDKRCGPVLTDIEQHIDPKHKGYYRDNDPLTWGHETTHGISSDIQIGIGKPGVNGFYCLENRAILVADPKVKITDVAPLVPKVVRGGRYTLYLVDQTSQWNNTPTYILDEWVAYTNGAAVGADQLKHGLEVRGGTSDDAISPMEFTYYTLALCQAIKKHDPDYFKNNPNFSEFVAFNIRRSFNLYKELIVQDKFKWDKDLIVAFIDSNETAELKSVAVELWGKPFVDKYLLTK